MAEEKPAEAMEEEKLAEAMEEEKLAEAPFPFCSQIYGTKTFPLFSYLFS
jgi:hypothetical protein